jgi:osmotically-inducible protein OsmY
MRLKKIAMETDTLIRQRVLDELDFNPSFTADDIGVAVRDGIVTLSGYVPSYVQKVAVEEAVQRIPGVRAVAEDMVVRLADDDRQDDDEIARRAADLLGWTLGVPKPIQIVVDAGHVTLKGEARWKFQSDTAERAVRHLAGVVSVTNRISIKQPVTKKSVKPDAVAESIRKAFERNADLDSKGVRIDVDGGKVVLSGFVRTWFERRMAQEAAWSMPGVTAVTDNLDVADIV